MSGGRFYQAETTANLRQAFSMIATICDISTLSVITLPMKCATVRSAGSR
jgi:hypothetical protein